MTRRNYSRRSLYALLFAGTFLATVTLGQCAMWAQAKPVDTVIKPHGSAASSGGSASSTIEAPPADWDHSYAIMYECVTVGARWLSKNNVNDPDDIVTAVFMDCISEINSLSKVASKYFPDSPAQKNGLTEDKSFGNVLNALGKDIKATVATERSKIQDSK